MADAFVVASATGSSQASISRRRTGVRSKKPNASRRASSCSYRVWKREA